jgi:fatty acid-binding protein DegV
MHEQRTGAPREGVQTATVAEVEEQTDRLILSLLSSSQFPGLWSVNELAREIGKPIDVEDTIHRLHGQGLIHRLDDFVFVTHAAACCEALRL